MTHTRFNILLPIVLLICIVSCQKNTESVEAIAYGTMQDSEGNTYKTVKIGDAWWMAENLRATKFSDSTPIQLVSPNDSNSFWSLASIPCYTALNSGTNGMLYNGHVVKSEKRIAPAGWHIATDTDWKKLEAEIGMPTAELNLTGWRGSNTAQELATLYSAGWPSGVALFGTNAYGFHALPGGCRLADGRTNIFNTSAFWWTSSTEINSLYYRYIDAYQQEIFRQTENSHYGMSIRCVKD